MIIILKFCFIFLLWFASGIVMQATGAVQNDFGIADAGFHAKSVIQDGLFSSQCAYDFSGALSQQRRSLDGKGDDGDGRFQLEEFESKGAAQPLLSFSAEFVAARTTTRAADDVIHVTPSGVAFPSGSKYKIPSNYVENAHRPGSYGVIENGRFVERLRIDPATPPGMKGPNYGHYHLDGGKTHFSPRPGDPNPGFNP